MRSRYAWALLSVALGLSTRDASAQTAKKKTNLAASPAKKVAKPPKKAAANVVQWPGFRVTDDGGSEVMVEFSSKFAKPTEHHAAGSITYVFKGAHVIKANNQNPLITVHFNTPVVSARLVPKKGELHLVVDIRPGASAIPSLGVRASADGDAQQFFIKFPSGTYLPKGAENAEIAPSPTQKLELNNDNKKTKNDSTSTPKKSASKIESGGKTGPAP